MRASVRAVVHGVIHLACPGCRDRMVHVAGNSLGEICVRSLWFDGRSQSGRVQFAARVVVRRGDAVSEFDGCKEGYRRSVVGEPDLHRGR